LGRKEGGCGPVLVLDGTLACLDAGEVDTIGYADVVWGVSLVLSLIDGGRARPRTGCGTSGVAERGHQGFGQLPVRCLAGFLKPALGMEFQAARQTIVWINERQPHNGSRTG